MNYEKLKFRATGVTPLLMHNGQMADPMNAFARLKAQVSKKRAKTDADFEELARLEFLGGLYHRVETGPGIPGEMIEATLINAAKKSRKGMQAKAGLISEGFWPLEYDGPRVAEDLWEDEKFRLTIGVRQQNQRIMRTRPRFFPWACEFEVEYLPDQLNEREITEFVQVAGRLVGFGDWRPRCGRFETQKLS